MTDRTEREQIMKRTAIILGVAATMGVVPSVASGGNITTQDRPQDKAQIVAQVLKPQPLNPARVTVARVSSHIFSVQKIPLLRIQAR
ncbi:MAG: hypothetical protein ACR2M2_08985 [Gaiellaceae bacterium]|nr:hypothetical protein [Actinomycetota bacterium]